MVDVTIELSDEQVERIADAIEADFVAEDTGWETDLPSGATEVRSTRLLTVYKDGDETYVQTEDGRVRQFDETDAERLADLLDDARVSVNGNLASYDGDRDEPFDAYGGPAEYFGSVKGIHVWNDVDGDSWIADDGGNARLFWSETEEEFYELLDADVDDSDDGLPTFGGWDMVEKREATDSITVYRDTVDDLWIQVEDVNSAETIEVPMVITLPQNLVDAVQELDPLQ